MNVLTRSAYAAVVAATAVFLSSCSGGVSVPAAGSVATPTALPATATPASTTTTPPATGTATPTPVSVTTTAPAATATPVPVTTTPPASSTPTPVATPTASSPATSGCPPSFGPQPQTSTAPWPSGGGTIALPMFGDQMGSVTVPTNNASSGTKLQFETSQTTFTDGGGNGNIPTPPAGDTAISYTASGLMPAQTITFGGTQEIEVKASSKCYITAGHTYVAFVYANGGGFNHSELSPTAGYAAPMASDGSVSFTINLSASGGLNPMGVYLETIFAQQS